MRALTMMALVTFWVLLAPVSASAEPVSAPPARAGLMSTGELIEALGLDEVFVQFGPSIEVVPDQQGAPLSAAMHSAWIEAARRVFAPTRMRDRLATLLDDKFRPGDYAAFTRFYSSAVGQRIVAADRAAAGLAATEQTIVYESAGRLAAEATPERREQVAQMLGLVSAELATQIVRHSVRGVLVGLWLSERPSGDIAVPWEEIERQLAELMPRVEADLQVGQEAMTFYAYRHLTDADLDEYIRFLRTEPARRLYVVVVHAVGEVVGENMRVFGETIARRLKRVNV